MATKPLSIEEIMLVSAQTSKELGEAGKEKQEILKKQEALANEGAAAAEAKGNALAVIENAKGLALLKAQETNVQIAKAAGITEDANILIENHALLQESQRRTIQKAAEVRRKWDSTIAKDGFLEWMKNGLTVGMDQRELQANVQEMQTIDSALASTNARLQSSFQTTVAKAEIRNASTIAATAEAIAADAQMEAIKYRLEGLNYNMAGRDQIRQMTLDQFNLLQTTQGMANESERMRMAREDQAMQLEQFAWQREEAAMRKQLMAKNLKEAELDEQMDTAFIAKYQAGLKALGKPDMDADEVRYVLKMRKSGNMQKENEEIYRVGAQTLANQGKQTLGSNPAEAYDVISIPGVNIPETQAKTRELMDMARTLIPMDKATSKDPNVIRSSFNEQVSRLVKTQYEVSVAKGSAFDVGNIGDPDILTAPAMQSLPVVKNFLAPLAANKQDMSDPQTVLELVRAGMKRGELKSSAAQELATVYAFANRLNQADRNFAGYGIRLPGGGATYKVRIGRDIYDLANPTDVTRYLMKPPPSPFSRTSSPFLNM